MKDYDLNLKATSEEEEEEEMKEEPLESILDTNSIIVKTCVVLSF